MGIITTIKSTDYMIPHDFYLRDTRLSLKAKGLMAQIHAYPLKADFSIESLTFDNQDGIKSIRAALHELEHYSYIDRYQGRDENGHLLPVEFTIFENPYHGIELDDTNDEPIEIPKGDYSIPPQNTFTDSDKDALTLIVEVFCDLFDGIFTKPEETD